MLCMGIPEEEEIDLLAQSVHEMEFVEIEVENKQLL